MVSTAIELQVVQNNMPVAGALGVGVHDISSVVRAIDTTNGQLSVDLIRRRRQPPHQHPPELTLAYELRPRKWNSSHTADSVEFSERVLHSQSRHVSPTAKV